MKREEKWLRFISIKIKNSLEIYKKIKWKIIIQVEPKKILTTKWQYNETEFIFGRHIHDESKYVRCINAKWISVQIESKKLKIKFKLNNSTISIVLVDCYDYNCWLHTADSANLDW